jgi:glycosyltransferase involved in cell wall biosynthesis
MNTPATDCCVLIPGYHEEGRIGAVVREVLQYVAAVVVIDDGSTDKTADEARDAGATVLVHEVNKGKGAALETGFTWAREQGFDCLITMDADGQHAPGDLPGFLEAYRLHGTPVLIGNRMDDPVGMPFIRRMTNMYMSGLLSRHMGQRVPDTQNGYRLYKTEVLQGITCGARFDAESEILLTLAGRGVKMGAVPIQVIYGDEKSKIHPVRDTVRFFRMLRRKRQEGE